MFKLGDNAITSALIKIRLFIHLASVPLEVSSSSNRLLFPDVVDNGGIVGFDITSPDAIADKTIIGVILPVTDDMMHC